MQSIHDDWGNPWVEFPLGGDNRSYEEQLNAWDKAGIGRDETPFQLQQEGACSHKTWHHSGRGHHAQAECQDDEPNAHQCGTAGSARRSRESSLTAVSDLTNLLKYFQSNDSRHVRPFNVSSHKLRIKVKHTVEVRSLNTLKLESLKLVFQPISC